MKKYGAGPRVEALASQYPGLLAGRIISQEKGQYRLIDSVGEGAATVSGKFRHEALTVSDYPAVGDFVMVAAHAPDELAVIHAVLPRRSVFMRRAAGTAKSEQVVAANVDTVFICMSLNNDFNIRRLERYLSVGWDSGANPIIVLTKSDLCDDVKGRVREVEGVASGADVLVTSSMEIDGYTAVLPYFGEGKTVAFIGSSGVGKSTLINRLLGEGRLATGGLRNDDKGHHTTTRRELILLPSGGMVIDTPGMRELGVWDAGEGVDTAFADIAALAENCRFSDCAHRGEPGCAVRAAIERGELSPERWTSYQKLKNENAYAADSEGYIAAKTERFKAIMKAHRNDPKK